MGTVLRLLGIGWYIALCLIGGVFGGLWLDDRVGSRPLFTLLGMGVGLAIAAVGTYRMLMAVVSQDQHTKNQSKE